ncbi:MAG: alpha/beta hydrolase [Chloroflexi bacterium]|nr:alpha/beta hydrolase [Chloroflexota bacterium]MDA1146279.1 alpha/beta hydrolase [Chloroflexota bacterium]
MSTVEYGAGTLPPGIRSRTVPNGNGLTMHILEAGFEESDRPLVLLLHGFPELAYSWRKLLPPLAAAGYHVVAPDQRGYGRTTGWDGDYDGDLRAYGMLNLVRDALGLVSALGRREVAAVVGHDFGSPVAAWCALTRPDVFRSVALMSAPFGGPPAFPFDTADRDASGQPADLDIHEALAKLPRPRRHYQRYYSTREANENMWRAPQGVHDFLRAYYHAKSADWPDNRPFALGAWTAEAVSQLPTYYVMDLDMGMAETVAAEMPSREAIEACAWLTEDELHVYSGEYGRTGFQGGLQWYRAGAVTGAELLLFSGRTIEVPSMFVSGASDWGVRQRPGNLERMQSAACSDFRGVHLLEGAGHWVQQEQADEVARLLLEFLASR